MSGNYMINNHFREIRYRLIYSILGFVSLSFITYLYSYTLLDILGFNFTEVIISTNISESFSSQIKLSIALGLILNYPLVLLQIYMFICPGLYNSERLYGLRLILISVSFYSIFLLLSTFVLYPIAMNFFSSYQSNISYTEIILLPGIQSVINFYLHVTYIFCILSQLPVISYILITNNYITTLLLVRTRKIWIVSSFIIGAILSPPDVLSQMIVASSLLLFYEILIIFTLYEESKAQ